jgi:hypothetical protein
MDSEVAQQIADAITKAASSPVLSDVMTTTDMIQYGALAGLTLLVVISLLQPKKTLKDIVKSLNDHQLKR